MKKILIVTILLSGCGLLSSQIDNATLKGEYPGPLIVNSEKEFETLWDNAIDAFILCNIPVKTIDKDSGLLISDTFNNRFVTVEEDGKPFKDTCHFVIPYYNDYITKTELAHLYPVNAQLICRIREMGDVRNIYISFANIDYYSRSSDRSYPAASLGNFERIFYRLITGEK